MKTIVKGKAGGEGKRAQVVEAVLNISRNSYGIEFAKKTI